MREVGATQEPSRTDVIQLRVHGVSGAQARNTLDRPHAQQVAGDHNAGFYRPRLGYPDSRDAGGTVLEVYRWSDLPSGTASRTLWLLFMLPFMLGNVAIWMHPAGADKGAGVKALCRLLALSLTLLYVLSVVGVALDLLAWKCPSSPQCLDRHPWLSWLTFLPMGTRLALSATVPIGAVGALWWVTSLPGRRPPAFQPSFAAQPTADRLDRVGWGRSAAIEGRLRSVHLAAAFATIDVTLLLAVGIRNLAWPGLVALLSAGFILGGGVALLCVASRMDRQESGGRADGLARGLRTVSCGLTLWVLCTLAASEGPWPDAPGLPGYEAVLTSVFLSQTVLVAGLGLAVLRQRKRHDGRPRLLPSLGAPVMAATSVGLAVAFAAELVFQTSRVLGHSPGATTAPDVAPPLVYEWAICAFMVAIGFGGIVWAIVTLAGRPRRSRAAARLARDDYPDAPASAAPRLRQAARIIGRAQATEQLGPAAISYACLTVLGMTTTVLGLVGLSPATASQRWLGVPAGLVTFGIGVGAYFILAILAALVVGGIFAYRTVEFRRYVGVLWDLGTFWPRAAHPFAPTCYADRAVPELAKRITYLTGRGHGVVAVGHSHGSVLLTAAVLQLTPAACSRLALLTHGSPLRRLYGGLFPAYLGEDVLHNVGEALDWRWVNLWRRTDSVGSWMFTEDRDTIHSATSSPESTVDRRLHDPAGLLPPPQDSVAPSIQGHRPCESDPRFSAAVRELATQLRAG